MKGKPPKQRVNFMVNSEVTNMREEYDFSNARKNPYAKQLKKQITINLVKREIASCYLE